MNKYFNMFLHKYIFYIYIHTEDIFEWAVFLFTSYIFYVSKISMNKHKF